VTPDGFLPWELLQLYWVVLAVALVLVGCLVWLVLSVLNFERRGHARD
jgi:uncharacterized membrane protein